MSKPSFWILYFAGIFFIGLNFNFAIEMFDEMFLLAVVYSLILIASIAFFFDDKGDEEEPKKFVNCGRPECAKCTYCKGCIRH